VSIAQRGNRATGKSKRFSQDLQDFVLVRNDCTQFKLTWIQTGTYCRMRTNNYLVDELIDWSNVPNDPMFRLVFPQPDMLSLEHSATMRNLIDSGEGHGVKL